MTKKGRHLGFDNLNYSTGDSKTVNTRVSTSVKLFASGMWQHLNRHYPILKSNSPLCLFQRHCWMVYGRNLLQAIQIHNPIYVEFLCLRKICKKHSKDITNHNKIPNWYAHDSKQQQNNKYIQLYTWHSSHCSFNFNLGDKSISVIILQEFVRESYFITGNRIIMVSALLLLLEMCYIS